MYMYIYTFPQSFLVWTYCKTPKNLDTRKNCYSHTKIEQGVMHPKDADGIANSVDSEAVWSGSALFAVVTQKLNKEALP